MRGTGKASSRLVQSGAREWEACISNAARIDVRIRTLAKQVAPALLWCVAPHNSRGDENEYFEAYIEFVVTGSDAPKPPQARKKSFNEVTLLGRVRIFM
jgi:hypothetical protein